MKNKIYYIKVNEKEFKYWIKIFNEHGYHWYGKQEFTPNCLIYDGGCYLCVEDNSEHYITYDYLSTDVQSFAEPISKHRLMRKEKLERILQ